MVGDGRDAEQLDISKRGEGPTMAILMVSWLQCHQANNCQEQLVLQSRKVSPVL